MRNKHAIYNERMSKCGSEAKHTDKILVVFFLCLNCDGDTSNRCIGLFVANCTKINQILVLIIDIVHIFFDGMEIDVLGCF